MDYLYNCVSDENELRWFFDHVIFQPQPYESYSMILVSRHKKLTPEEKEALGLTRRESEFLKVETVRKPPFKDAFQNIPLTAEKFIQQVYKLNFDKRAYLSGKGMFIPNKTLAVIFYVNPCDDIKVWNKTVIEMDNVKDGLVKAMIAGKTADLECKQSFQAFGNVLNTIKHNKAQCKGSRYWMDFDIDVPKWFKANEYHYDFPDGTKGGYFTVLKNILTSTFGKGNYVIVDTSGGYHILVRTSAIKKNPHDFCKEVQAIYDEAIQLGEEPYLDEKGVCKFECIINDSQIPGLPLPGTYQYGRPVTVLNKEDFE